MEMFRIRNTRIRINDYEIEETKFVGASIDKTNLVAKSEVSG